jgi:hypothetical protein
VAIFMYLVFYKPLNPLDASSLGGFWHDWIADHDWNALKAIVLRSARMECDLLRQGALLGRLPYVERWLPWLLVTALPVGTVLLSARLPALAVLLASCLFTAGAASFVGAWPFGLIRMNFAFFWLPHLAISLAIVTVLPTVFEMIPRGRAVVIGMCALALIPTSAEAPAPWLFARGIEDDLAIIAQTPAERNIVLSYHFMSYFYPEYYLEQRVDSKKRFRILPERRGDRSLFTDLSAKLAGLATDGDAIWCLIPYELGPEVSQACRLDAPLFAKFSDVMGKRAHVMGFRYHSGAPEAR